VITPLLPTADPDRKGEVNLDETQQNKADKYRRTTAAAPTGDH